MPKAYRFSTSSIAAIMDNYAKYATLSYLVLVTFTHFHLSQFAEQFGTDFTSPLLAQSLPNLNLHHEFNNSANATGTNSTSATSTLCQRAEPSSVDPGSATMTFWSSKGKNHNSDTIYIPFRGLSLSFRFTFRCI